MKSDRLIVDLLRIAEIEGISRENGADARKRALMTWFSDWVVELKYEQSIIDKRISAEEEDFLKGYMAEKASELLLEECTYLDRKKNKIKLKIFALRRER